MKIVTAPAKCNGPIITLSYVITKCQGRLNLTLKTIQLNAWVAGNLPLSISFLSVILQCYKSNRSNNHTATVFITIIIIINTYRGTYKSAIDTQSHKH